ncbi:hypothetical protein [Polaribacter butkevichii]|uniref:Uncharacterized protein n=1 Tax=Polaribacter butkevichii TaxID=218490 RepID=A0A2P6CAK1_9FLAO|nr:hypothetical protein [Polaribacter butkevichii]PQJ71919.1 hypothetical protein BTO14_01030 [Polaribacter butkevichii]
MNINKKLDEKEEVNQSKIETLAHEELESNSWIIDKEYKYLKNLNFYISIISDLEYVINCISELQIIREKEKHQKEERILIKRSLFISVITTYGRCFTCTKKNGRIWLNKNLITEYFPKNSDINSKDLIKFHEYIMNLRHKYIAHADENNFESTRAYIEFEFDYKSFILNSKIKNFTAGMYNFDETQMSNFKIISNCFLAIVEIKKSELVEKLKNEIGNEKLKQIGIPIAKRLNI